MVEIIIVGFNAAGQLLTIKYSAFVRYVNFEFTDGKETSANHFCDLGLMSVHTQTQHTSTAVKKGHCYTKNFAMRGGDESVQDRKRENGTRMEDSEYLLDDGKERECFSSYPIITPTTAHT